MRNLGWTWLRRYKNRALERRSSPESEISEQGGGDAPGWQGAKTEDIGNL
jgi:hypothetical protein